MSWRLILRNLIEYLVIVAIWWCLQQVIGSQRLSPQGLLVLVLATSWVKTIFFGVENMQQLLHASRSNTAYHRFMMLMLVNMSQIIASFALDYHCLFKLNPECLGGVNPAFTEPELIFECFYFSLLNFTFFGYGDITPQTVPAKLVTMTEVGLAFVTVIFVLSDFISLKESISRPHRPAS